MIIEFIGCAGSGKSSLSCEVKNLLTRQEIKTTLSDQLIGQPIGIANIKSKKLRSLVIDFMVFPWFFVFICFHLKFSAFILWKTFSYSDSYLVSLNLIRNIIKKMGIYQYLQRGKFNEQIILVDEGIVHAAHNVFVHFHSSPKLKDIVSFAASVPLPDMIIYVKSTQERQIERTMFRGHRRMRNKLKPDIVAFVSHANSLFENLTSAKRIRNRLVMVNNVEEGRESVQSTAHWAISSILDRLSVVLHNPPSITT